MKTIELEISREKLQKALEQKALPDTWKTRLSFYGEDVFLVKAQNGRIRLYRKKKNFFPLFACVLHGKIESEGKKLTLRIFYARPAPSAVLLAVWSVFMAVAAVSVLPDMTEALLFAALSVVGASSLFVFRPSARRDLEEWLLRLGKKDT